MRVTLGQALLRIGIILDAQPPKILLLERQAVLVPFQFGSGGREAFAPRFFVAGGSGGIVRSGRGFSGSGRPGRCGAWNIVVVPDLGFGLGGFLFAGLARGFRASTR